MTKASIALCYRAAGLLGLAALIIWGIVSVVTTYPANAKPQFAAETKKPCGFCHTGPSGGPLNPTGEKFKQNGYKL